MFSALLNRFYKWSARYLVVASIATAGLSLVFAPALSDAARLGGGKSFGTQSSGAMKGTAPTMTQKSATPSSAAPAGAPPSSAAAPRSGASRFLGPLAGIAAGLGIGMLMSHLGFGGAMGEILTLVIFAALAFFVLRLVMRLFLGRGQSAQTQSASVLANAYPQAAAPVPQQAPQQIPQQMWRQADASASGSSGTSVATSSGVANGSPMAENSEPKWFIPADFDTQSFIQEAKKHFVAIQKIWDSGDVTQLHQFLTDDLIKALQGQFDGRQGVNETEVVMLNAELLGMEKVTDGHLASVRFSGMLREKPQTEAFRFEEIWNLYKSEQGGWMLAGIQQIPVELAS